MVSNNTKYTKSTSHWKREIYIDKLTWFRISNSRISPQLICPKGEVFISGILITHCEVAIKVYRRLMTAVESEIITLHWTT